MNPLQIFEKHPAADAYRVGGFYSPYALVSTDKRFAEAELCAEFEAARCDSMVQRATGSYWAPLGETWPTDPESVSRRTSTLLHFASSPHASDSDYQ